MNTWNKFGKEALKIQEVAVEWKFSNCIYCDKLGTTRRDMLSLYANESIRQYKVCIGLAMGMLAELEGMPIYRFNEDG